MIMKRLLFFVLIVSFVLVPTMGQTRKNGQYQNYINQYKDLAIEQMVRYRIPASITLAHGLLESGAGMSE